MSVEEFQVNNDNEDDTKKQNQLRDAILNLNKKSQLKKASRAEPTTEISEFSLVKSLTGKGGSIKINELTKGLKKRAKQVEISKQVINPKSKAKTLSTPLEKPAADRIRRVTAFGKVQKELSRWDAVVSSHRASDNLVFPLPTDENIESNKSFRGYRLKSKLQEELEAIDPKIKVYNVDVKPKFRLTLKEMLERRQELARMRALQSYSEAKARRQGKIKSKKYHRVQRKAKIKEQIKEFEKLQESDPAEALKKLEHIEKVRAEERASLRHRSTGKWAQSKQVRAKYDKESRQVLAQQLAISRELTQKIKNVDDSDEDVLESSAPPPQTNGDNPWTSSDPTSGEVNNFIMEYKKFREEEDQSENLRTTPKETIESEKSPKLTAESSVESEQPAIQKEAMITTAQSCSKTRDVVKRARKASVIEQKPVLSKKRKNSVEAVSSTTKLKVISSNRSKVKCSSLKRLKLNKKVKVKVGTTSWDVEEVSDDMNTSDEQEKSNKIKNLDEAFDNLDKKLQKEFRTKCKTLKQSLQAKENYRKPLKKKKRGESKTTFDLTLPKTIKRPILDEELIENSGRVLEHQDSNQKITSLKALLEETSEEKQQKPKNAQININPNAIIKTKASTLDNELPDLVVLGDDEEEDDELLRGTISEAFEDVDIVDEFQKDKRKEIEKDIPEDISLALPGWGSWGGLGIKMSKRKKKRFIVKFPKDMKRKDSNKGNLIINENANTDLKRHLVTEVPFPFTTVQDYEASIRAPIGSTFVPETAFRKMIAPAVRTRMGTVIEPMTDDVLLKKDRKKF